MTVMNRSTRISTQAGSAAPGRDPERANSSFSDGHRSRDSYAEALYNGMTRDALYAEFAPLIKRLTYQYGRTIDARLDLHGEMYCRFCSLLEEFDPSRGVPLRPYIVKQLTSAVHTFARKQWNIERRETAMAPNDSESDHLFPSFDPTPSWDTDLSRRQIANSLPEAIMNLPERQQRVVIWRYYEERSFDEIASLLNVESSTARSLLRFGLAGLRKQMQAMDMVCA